MRVLVCGGREFTNQPYVFAALDAIHAMKRIKLIINGGARGADSISSEWATSRNVPARVYIPDWNTYGRGAGIIRNKEMLAEGKPDLVVALPGGKGTADMIDRSRQAQLPVLVLGGVQNAPVFYLPPEKGI